MPTVSFFFDACREFDPRCISPLMGVCGLYFIALKRIRSVSLRQVTAHLHRHEREEDE